MPPEAGNVGIARLQVEFLSGSPFSAIPRQEWSYYFDNNNLDAMAHSNIDALPPPFNGFRISEHMDNYDNFLQDISGTSLEDSGVDPAATERAKNRPSTDEEKKDFFTWQVNKNMFQTTGGAKATAFSQSPGEIAANQSSTKSNDKGANPPPLTFKEALSVDNAPTWTYVLKTKPDAARTAATQASILTPFMTRVTSDPSRPVHWGCKTLEAIALNQPFEIFYYHDGQTHAVAESAEKLSSRFNLDVDLTRRAYLAIEIGIGTAYDHYIMLFVQGESPKFYHIIDQAVLLSEFDGFSGEKLFNADDTIFTCKIEPVANGLLVTSNSFDGKFWAITGGSPVFVGQGPIGLYSGNIQCGFAMRPVQYEAKGTFRTPSTTVVQTASQKLKCTTSLKGSGDAQQDQSGGLAGGETHAVDAERVNGKPCRSFFEASAGEPIFRGGTRRIDIKPSEVNDANNDPAAQSSYNAEPASQSKRTYDTIVDMYSTNVSQPGGYVVEKGRSPYIWQMRCELPGKSQGTAPGVAQDVSCDVLSCDLSWNSTSFNELNHTGTLRMLNRPSVSKINYKSYTNRAVYLRISAWWDNGLGHDPGGDGRQVFEGMTTSATVDTKAEIETVTFKVEDYMNALQGGKFDNSPAYDGMSAPAAVRDIVQQLGIPRSRILVGNTQVDQQQPDGKTFILPFANISTAPEFRFKNGSSFKEAVLRIATLDGMTIYFDQKGRFHYDPVQGGILGNQDVKSAGEFFSSPRTAVSMSTVCWNMRSFTRAINDTYNAIKVASVDKATGDYIVVGDNNDAAINDPQAEGYLGYRKLLTIAEPALGSYAAVAKYLDAYRQKLFIPPLTVRFELYGYSGLKPLDVISIDGIPCRIVNISSTMNAQENRYWMTIEGEWFFGGPGKWDNNNLAPANVSEGSPGDSGNL